MKYCVFNLKTGEIRARFETRAADAERQLQPGEGLFVGDADPRTHMIAQTDGELVAVAKPIDEQAQSERLAKMKMQMADTQTIDIDGERINFQRSVLEYITAESGSSDEAAALGRLQKMKAYKESLRTQVSAGKGTSERSG
jgi:hypothetical protein